MALSEQGQRRPDDAGRPIAKRDRRPLRYRSGTLVRTNERRIELACLDGRVLPIRLAERTLYRLAGQRLSGADALCAGLEVRVATVDSGRGSIAVLVELLARGHDAANGGQTSAVTRHAEFPEA